MRRFRVAMAAGQAPGPNPPASRHRQGPCPRLRPRVAAPGLCGDWRQHRQPPGDWPVTWSLA